ncbi:MAG: hypothetical protein IT454_22565 [Planctomycetes bacterium]|nr:hypothetical protein [Planctomycetota bacterium]
MGPARCSVAGVLSVASLALVHVPELDLALHDVRWCGWIAALWWTCASLPLAHERALSPAPWLGCACAAPLLALAAALDARSGAPPLQGLVTSAAALSMVALAGFGGARASVRGVLAWLALSLAAPACELATRLASASGRGAEWVEWLAGVSPLRWALYRSSALSPVLSWRELAALAGALALTWIVRDGAAPARQAP